MSQRRQHVQQLREVYFTECTPLPTVLIDIICSYLSDLYVGACSLFYVHRTLRLSPGHFSGDLIFQNNLLFCTQEVDAQLAISVYRVTGDTLPGPTCQFPIAHGTRWRVDSSLFLPVHILYTNDPLKESISIYFLSMRAEPIGHAHFDLQWADISCGCVYGMIRGQWGIWMRDLIYNKVHRICNRILHPPYDCDRMVPPHNSMYPNTMMYPPRFMMRDIQCVASPVWFMISVSSSFIFVHRESGHQFVYRPTHPVLVKWCSFLDSHTWCFMYGKKVYGYRVSEADGVKEIFAYRSTRNILHANVLYRFGQPFLCLSVVLDGYTGYIILSSQGEEVVSTRVYDRQPVAMDHSGRVMYSYSDMAHHRTYLCVEIVQMLEDPNGTPESESWNRAPM